MSSNNKVMVGQRFSMLGQEFEVASVHSSLIRYSSVAGGKIQYMSHEKFDSLTRKGKLELPTPNTQDFLIPRNLSEKENKEKNRRLSYVRELYSFAKYPTSKKYAYPIIKKVAKEIDDANPPGISTVARWFKVYINANRNPYSLVSRNHEAGNRTLRFAPNIERIINNRIEKDYLSPQRITMRQVFCNIIGEIYDEYGEKKNNIYEIPKGIIIPSERTINRRINKIDAYYRSRKRKGKHIANKDFKAAGRGFPSSRILEVVEADGNILDVLVVDDETGEVMGRPYGTCLIDKYSRCIISFAITMIPFSSATLLKALKIAVSGNNEKFGGLFESIIEDNGSDYISNSVRNFCNQVGIQIEPGPPRDPDSKPHVERFFKTLNEQLVHILPGSTFSNPSKRGNYKSENYACISLEQLNGFIEQWLDDIYHKTVHRGHGRAPEMVWKESLVDHPITTFPLESLDKIARDVTQRTISKGRVTAHNIQWFSHALASLEQDCKNTNTPAKVDVYIDTLDLGKVFIKDPRNEEIFIQADAVFPDYADGLSLYEHNIIWAQLKEKGKKDKAQYGQNYLEIARWKLWQKIVNHGKEYSKKRIARIKETNKKNRLIKSELKDKHDDPTFSKSVSSPPKVDEFINPEVSSQLNPNPTQRINSDDSESFTTKRL